MASLPRETDDWPTFSPTTPHFFKIILKGNTSSDAKLRIPKNFVMKYGDDLSNPVSLELPSGSGSAWKVDLRRLDGEVWFDKGWADFSEFYSLDRGHWLVFGYQGNSKFQVCIFDRTCTEIDYPLRKQEMEETDDTDDDFREDSVEEQPDDSTCPRKTRKKSSLPCPRPQKKNRTSSRGTDDYPAKLGSGSTSSTRRFEKRTPGFLGRIRPLPKSGKAIALQRANAYKSQHPFSVIVAVKPSYITGFLLWLPSEFHKLYPIKNSGEVILRVLDRRTWPVNLKYGGGRAQFLSGWMDFVRDNNLKVHDVCVFELIDNKVKPLFDVVIFPNIEAANCPNDREQTVPEIEETNEDDDPSDDSGDDSGDADYLSDDSVEIIENCTPFPRRTKEKSPMPCPQPPKKNKASSSGKVDFPASRNATALQRANAFKSKHPFFKVAMRTSYIHNRNMNVPFTFVKKHLKQTNNYVFLRVSGARTWSVKLCQYAGRAKFQGGWPKFARENSLVKGDVCIFVLVNSIKPLFDVVFYRTRDSTTAN
ncbi:hypothetical protein ACE6H2_024514 [Prunus campanulata]